MHLEHYEPQASSWRGSFLMFAAGAAIGAAAALVMAPASGRESREYLRRQSKKVADDVHSQADRLASAVKWGRDKATTAVRETMDSAVQQAKAAYNAAKTSRGGELSATGTTATRPATVTPRAINSPS